MKVRVIRIIQYMGDYAAVEDAMQRCIHGTKIITNKMGYMTITAQTLGELPETLTEETPPEETL